MRKLKQVEPQKYMYEHFAFNINNSDSLRNFSFSFFFIDPFYINQ